MHIKDHMATEFPVITKPHVVEAWHQADEALLVLFILGPFTQVQKSEAKNKKYTNTSSETRNSLDFKINIYPTWTFTVVLINLISILDF